MNSLAAMRALPCTSAFSCTCPTMAPSNQLPFRASHTAQVIFALPPTGETDLTMRIYNSDGSEPEMCGNGIRCLARFVADLDSAAPRKYRIHTLAGMTFCQSLPPPPHPTPHHTHHRMGLSSAGVICCSYAWSILSQLQLPMCT